MKNFIQLHVHIQTWKNDILQNCDKKALLVLIGHKIDLKEERIVSYKEGNQFAKDNGMLFFEVSCKEGVNIEKIFNESAKLITDGIHIGKYDVDEGTDFLADYNIRNIPTILFFKDGKMVERNDGSVSKENLEAKIKALL